MFCYHCGKEIDDTANFCPHCGTQVSIPHYQPLDKDRSGYASFVERLGAHLIDHFLIALGFLVLFMIAGHILFSELGTLVLAWLYYASMESSEYMATLGKRAVGIKVITEDGQQISFKQASLRYFSKILSGIFFCIGYLMALFTKKQQALHDIIAKTCVVRS